MADIARVANHEQQGRSVFRVALNFTVDNTVLQTLNSSHFLLSSPGHSQVLIRAQLLDPLHSFVMQRHEY